MAAAVVGVVRLERRGRARGHPARLKRVDGGGLVEQGITVVIASAYAAPVTTPPTGGRSRQGVNPATGEKIQIAASKVPKFTAAKALKDSVNGR